MCIRDRHSGVDVFYLSQTCSQVPKQLVRDNANLVALFRQDELNLKHAYNDHVNTDMRYKTFKNICTEAWTDRYGCLVVVKVSPMDSGRYRVGFDRFIIPPTKHDVIEENSSYKHDCFVCYSAVCEDG